MDKNFPEWLKPVEKSRGSTNVELDEKSKACEIDDDVALLSEGASRELRKASRSDPDLHQETLVEVKKQLGEGNTVTIGSVKQILRKKIVDSLPKLELPKTVVNDSIENIETYLEPGSVDLILTDPPYVEDCIPLFSVLAEKAAILLKPGGFLISYSGHLHLPEILSRLTLCEGLSYVWTFALLHQTRATTFARNLSIKWKPLIIMARPPYDLPWMEDVIQGTGREKEGHEWQQSLGESEELINRFTVEGQLVVDPFFGSGTTLLAAKNTNRNYFGMDVDKVAVATAVRRLSDEK